LFAAQFPFHQEKTACGDKWCVVLEQYETSYGCHAGHPRKTKAEVIQTTDCKVQSEHSTEAEAKAAAREVMVWTDHFEDWAEEHYADGQGPPYDSAHGENYDNDDEVQIYVQRRSKFDSARKRDQAFVQKAFQKEIDKREKAQAKKKEAVAGARKVARSRL
jgi:hypothetical protein